jgi:hypothetical protein
MPASLKSRLLTWSGTALVAGAAAGLLLPLELVAQPPTGTVEKGDAPSAPPATTYIGELKGAPESARIAVVCDGDKFVAYVCSGDQKFNDSFSRWLRGDMKAGALAAADQVELKAALKGDTLTGTLSRDGKSHEFTAAAIAGDSNAGLFRAGDTFEDTDFVIGWIVDEKENVVGTGGARRGPVQTLKPPPGPPNGNGNLQGQVQKKGDDKAKVLEPGKVGGTGAGASASPTGVKLDAANKAEIASDLLAARKASDGNAIQAMLVNQVQRFVAGKKAETKLEEKTFAILKAAPKEALQDYLKDWEKIPKAEREALLGSAAKSLDVNKGLDSAVARKLAADMPAVKAIKAAAPAAAAPAGTVKKVSIPTIKCVDETNPEFVGSDEIFAIHTVIVGNGEPQVKRTGLVKEFDDGESKNFAAADADVFPLPGQSPAEGAEVFIVTTLYEDDGTGVVKVFNLVKPLISVGVVLAVEALNGDEKKLTEVQKALIKIAVDAAVSAALGKLEKVLVKPLGTDSIVVRADGAVTAEGGGAKSKMTFRQVKNGDVKFSYELSGFAVQR